MEVGDVVWFSSRPHPFVVQATPCLDLDCSCQDVWLTLTEVNLAGARLSEPLSFELRVDLRSFVEREPPQRNANIEALAREFLVRFPDERIEDLVAQWKEQRTIKRRLAEYRTGDTDRTRLLCYSEVIYEAGGLAKGGQHDGYFFIHQGREFLLEDHYCSNPACDCRKVEVGFWERQEFYRPKHRVEVRQLLMASFTLDGQLGEIAFCQEDGPAAKQLLHVWRAECGYQLEEFARRYQQIKAVGRRSFPPEIRRRRVDVIHGTRPPDLPAKRRSTSRAGRNDPCPCGSGLKFKRCCARRSAASD